MKHLNILMIPFELVFTTFLTFIVSVILSLYLFICILFDLIKGGYKNGFRRNIT